MLAFLLCVLGLSRPQLGSRVASTHSRQSNLFVAIDISRSMLATDTSPSRLGFAITYTQKLLERLPGVKVALFPFALDGYILIPLSTDISAVSDMLTSLNPNMTSAQGTDISQALETLLRDIQKMEDGGQSRKAANGPRPRSSFLATGRRTSRCARMCSANTATSTFPFSPSAWGRRPGRRFRWKDAPPGKEISRCATRKGKRWLANYTRRL